MTVRRPPRLLHTLLRLFPPAHRAVYGDEMWEAVQRQYAAIPAEGAQRAARTSLFVRSALGLFCNAWFIWFDSVGKGGRTMIMTLCRSVQAAGADARFIRRSLLRARGFTFTFTSVPAIAVAVVTASLAFVRGTLLREVPYPDAHDVVIAWGSNVTNGQVRDVVSGSVFLDLARETTTLTSMAAVHPGEAVILAEGRPFVYDALDVSVDFLRVLGVSPVLGQDFGESDRSSAGPAVAIVSHAFWRDRLGGDPSAVGSSIAMNGEPHTILGVLPSDFEFLLPTPVLLPLRDDLLALESRTHFHYWLFGRLAQAAMPPQATGELTGILTRIAEDAPGLTGWSMLVEPVQTISVAAVRSLILLLLGASGVVLLIRTAERRAELAVRQAVGAGRADLMRVVSLEVGVLVAAGAVFGLVGGALLLDLLSRIIPLTIPIPDSAASVRAVYGSFDRFVIVGGIFLASLAGALSLAPSMARIWRPRIGAASRCLGRQRGIRVLVAVELALTMALLVGAGLVTRSAANLATIDPGVDPDGLLTMYVGTQRDLDPPALARYFREVARRVETVPGVTRASMVDYAPFQGEDDFEGVRFADRPAPAPGQSIREEWRRVTDGFFEAAGLTILGGRGFGTVDFEGTPAVAVVNRAFADKHWSGRTAVGRRFDLSPSAYRSLEVVGVVEDVPTRGFATPPPPMVYVPLQGSPRVNMALFVRATGDPLERLDAIREAVWSVDSTQPIDRVFPMTALVEKAGLVSDLARTLVAGLATLSLLLAVVGVFGVVGFAVRVRRPELGIRLALGAGARRLQREIMADVAPLVGIGVVVGLLLGGAIARASRSLLHEVSAVDPGSLLAAALVLVGAACLATYLPSREVARIDPARTLHRET